ncbi:Tol-Pal system beta propeller repeat protein TolB [Vulgatibacter incomptus]|uniref:Tol-Pal system beta propeller repeat protein TolB n=1 Tax=Vulgatibacter incomptus TaxID=1391653 RepID=UPI001F0AA7A8|nr:Tol-Pal system beta propeller repeat protein TolB [Vulgatibacter incomptus]
MLRILASAVTALLVAAPSLAPAQSSQPVLEISGASFRPLPIAIAPPIAVGDEAAAADEIYEALTFDLQVSGLFEVVPRKAFLADPREPVGPEGIAWTRWSDVGAESLVKFEVTKGAQGPKASFKLYGIASQRLDLGSTLEGRRADARRIGHRFADELVKHFTKEPGAFSTRVAFVKRAKNSKEIWVADFDGRNAAPVTDRGGISLLPAWSPNGAELAFTFFKKSMEYPNGHPQLWKANLGNGRSSAFVGRGDLNSGASYSPDGSKVAFTLSTDGNPEIYVVNADGSGLKRITHSEGINASPSWSPDGKRIAFVSDRHGTPQIFVMDADGGNVERLTRQGNYNQTPAWSPRGDLIAFTARDERIVFDIFVVDVATKEVKRITQDQGQNEHPAWAPNGRMLMFSSDRGGKKSLWVSSADGNVQRKLGLADDGEYTDPAWGPFTK